MTTMTKRRQANLLVDVAVVFYVHLLMTSESHSLELSECNRALGMQTGDIPDSAITASSFMPNREPTSSRIRQELPGGAWCPAEQVTRESFEYLEIDLGQLKVLTMVETQGRFDNGQGQEFTEQYRLEYQREPGGRWFRFRNRRGQELFQGNTNTHISEMREIEPPIIARLVRFIPYSSHPKTVCLRVELYGCTWTDGTIEYRMSQGDRRRGDVELVDDTYDGLIIDGRLTEGLGQLTDGEEGQSNFRLDMGGRGIKGYEWIGWRSPEIDLVSGESGSSSDIKPPSVDIFFRFDAPRNFTAVRLHVNNMYSKEVRVFQSAVVTFSGTGSNSSQPPILFRYVRDTTMEYVRQVTIPLDNRIGTEVTLSLAFDARWMMISEVQFESVYAILPKNELTTTTTSNPAAAAAGSGGGRANDKTVNAPNNEQNSYSSDQLPDAIVDSADRFGGLDVENNTGGLAAYNVTVTHRKTWPDVSTVPSLDSTHIGIIVGCLAAFILILGAIGVFIFLRSRRHLCMSHKYVGKKGPKYSVRPPTSSASLLAFAPPGGSYVRPLPPVGKLLASDSPSARCSVSDPLIPVGNGIGSFTMNDGVSATVTATVGMGSSSTPSTVTTSTSSGYMPPQLPPPMMADISAMEFPRKNLRFVEMLGEGQFGEVFLCEASGVHDSTIRSTSSIYLNSECRMVAVKVLRRDAEERTRVSFQQEAKIMSRLNDANITRLVGVCFTDEPQCIILEYLKYGDLKRFLRRHVIDNGTVGKRTSLDILNYGCLVYLATQIASGMKYLEELNLVHRDLAARNCLVGDNYSVKVSDYGIGHNLYPSDYYTTSSKVLLPVRWMAWESVLFGRFSTKSDIWSFGVTMWEILTMARETPFANLTDEEVIDNCEQWYSGNSGSDVTSDVSGSSPFTELQQPSESDVTNSSASKVQYLDQPALCPREVYDLLRECWQRDEDRRPTFHEVHMFLQRKSCGFSLANDLTAADGGGRGTLWSGTGVGNGGLSATLSRTNASGTLRGVTRSTALPSYV